MEPDIQLPCQRHTAQPGTPLNGPHTPRIPASRFPMESIASRSATSPVSTSVASTAPTSATSKRDDLNDPVTIQFTNVQDVFAAINCIPGDFLIVEHVSPGNYADIEREREKRRRKFRFRRYDRNSQVLFITIPTILHEALHAELYMVFHAQLVSCGKHQSWKTSAAARFRAQHGHPGGDGGEGDSTGGPKPERQLRDDWPTLVIEGGASESLGELHNDMRWWFSASEHQVQIVVLAKFDYTRRAIVLEKWEEESWNTRPGATTTRHAAALRPVLRQHITITQNTNPVSYNVTRGALVLGFRLLFLRDPGPGEGDFVLSVQELEEYAENVWNAL